MCSSFCNKLYDACKGAMWGGKKVEEAFSDAATFCTGLRFDVDFGNKDDGSESGLKGCLDLPAEETMFIADEWCEIPIDPLMSVSARSAPSSALYLLSATLTVLLLRGGSSEYWGVKSNGEGKRTKAATAVPVRQYATLLRIAVGLFSIVAACGDPITATTVERWATAIGTDLSSLMRKISRSHEAQRIYNSANYTVTTMNGTDNVDSLQAKLRDWFQAKEDAVLRLQKQVEEDVHGMLAGGATFPPQPDVPAFFDRDDIIDIPGLAYDERFKCNVTRDTSTIKVPHGVYQRECGTSCQGALTSLPEDARAHIKLSDGLEMKIFNSNLQSDSSLRWQYVGFQSGIFRQFPGYNDNHKPIHTVTMTILLITTITHSDTVRSATSSNHLGVPKNYDPRLRPWYISAASAPKDVVIIIDSSASMLKSGRLHRAKATAKTLLQTLSKKDYVNVIAASGPHKCNCRPEGSAQGDGIQRAFCPTKCNDCPRETRALGCVPNVMFPATSSVVNDLSERIDDLQAANYSQKSVNC